jgi:hypothetical protein
MSTLEQAPRAGHESKGGLGMVLTALGMLVVVAVVVVFLTLPGASSHARGAELRTSTATHSTGTQGQIGGATPLIHYRGTGRPRPTPPALYQPPFRYTGVGLWRHSWRTGR